MVGETQDSGTEDSSPMEEVRQHSRGAPVQIRRAQANAIAPCCGDSHHSDLCNQDGIECYAASLAKLARALARARLEQVQNRSQIHSRIYRTVYYDYLLRAPIHTANVRAMTFAAAALNPGLHKLHGALPPRW